MVDLVLMQADRPHQVHLDLVAGGQTADQVGAAAAVVLCDREDRRDVVARMRVLRGQERVVEVELTHRDTVRPRRPLGREGATDTEDRRTGGVRVRQRLGPGVRDGTTGHGRGGDGRVVDDPVDNHLGGVGRHLDRVGCDLGDLPPRCSCLGKFSAERRVRTGCVFKAVSFDVAGAAVSQRMAGRVRR